MVGAETGAGGRRNPLTSTTVNQGGEVGEVEMGLGRELSPLVALDLRERRRGSQDGGALTLAERPRAGRKGIRRQVVGAIATGHRPPLRSAQGSLWPPTDPQQFTRDEIHVYVRWE